ncbi:MAG: FAD-binding protein [Proteobacteria bacterium]|nr:FAD-binding protein [Pseudomonadota bacterium]MBU1687214.1 FAD-binding protein [Pseudomonadota bacterium]
MDQELLKNLRAIVGAKHLSTTPEDRLCYSYDGTGQEFLPDAVIFPGSTEEVSRIMALANQVGLPVVPRGAGSGMTGGSLAVQGGLILAMSRFNKIIEIDRENQIGVVEPGVITGEFQDRVQAEGLFYPPDPASRQFCSIGGNVAECAGGPRAVKYGVTRDYVLGLEAVLPSGAVVKTGVRTAKGVAGYDLTRLLVGSEGTLAVITRITLKLLALPTATTTFQLIFDDLHQAVTLVSRLLNRMTPATLEYLDHTVLNLVKSDLPGPLPAGATAMLIIELDGDPESVALQSRNLKSFVQGHEGLSAIHEAATPAEAETLWAARRAISPATFRLKPHKISEDVVVPRNRIPQLVATTEALADRFGLTILTFGHAGDGNIHVNIMLDRNDPVEQGKAHEARGLLFEAVIALGGTITGEHGVGITKADFLDNEIDRSTMALMRAIKHTFDPNNILNPGKIFPVGDRSVR